MKMVRRTVWTEENKQKLRERYPQEGPDLLAEELSLTKRQVMVKASELRVPSLNHGARASRGRLRTLSGNSVDPSFFDDWSIEVAWAIGYIWADGCVVKGVSNQLKLSCSWGDREILAWFKEKLKSVHKLRQVERLVYGKGKTYAVLDISGQSLVDVLIQKYGILPRKSFQDLGFPEVPSEFLPHFCRGYLDGDGSIENEKNGFDISFYGKERFLLDLKLLLTSLHQLADVQIIMRHPRGEHIACPN